MNITVLSDADWLKQINALSPELAISASIRQAAMLAIDGNLQAKPFTLVGETHRTPVALMSSHESKLKQYAVKNKSMDSQAALVSFLANAWLHNIATATTTDDSEQTEYWYDSVLSAAGMTKRKEQSQLIKQLNEAAISSKASLHEASTGVGKTLAILLAAAQKFREGNFQRIVVAVPTQAILKQFENQLPRIQLGDDIRIGVARARTAYLSHFACEDVIEDEGTPESIKQKLKQLIAGGNYRASELAEYEDEISLDDLLLMPDYHDDDLGGLQYERERAHWGSFNIIISTHSMIALDSTVRRRAIHDELKKIGEHISFGEYSDMASIAKRKGDPFLPRYCYINIEHFKNNAELIDRVDRNCQQLLPYYDALFIDEAHIFPEMVALSLQSSISLYSLILLSRRALELKCISKTQHQLFHTLWEKATKLFNPAADQGSIVIRQGDLDTQGGNWWQLVHDSVPELKKMVTKCGKSKNPHARRFMWQLNQMIRMIEGVQQRNPIEINFSPVQKYPRLTTYGSNDYALAITHFTWYRAKHTAYVSATLSLSNTGIGDYANAIARLTLDRTSVKTYPPILAPWLFEGVSVHLYKEHQESLTKNKYSRDANQEEAREHLTAQAELIYKIQQEAIGGTLVLCTSYLSIQTLSKQLADAGSISVICSHPSKSINRCVEEFLERYHAGEKTVWLATGAAWVGLDISDSSALPEEDNLIQNLVIQQLPYPSQNEGNKNKVFVKIQAEALLKMKQGIGRQIRRSGRKNMKIHVLDGRIHERAHAKFLQLFAPYPIVKK